MLSTEYGCRSEFEYLDFGENFAFLLLRGWRHDQIL